MPISEPQKLSRFYCPSITINLKGLLAKTRKEFRIALLLAAIVHISFAGFRGLELQQKVAKPLTTQFIKREPRLTKPLEMKKKPRPKRRQMRREMVSVKARVNRKRVSGTIQSDRLVGRLARPTSHIGRAVTVDDVAMDPKVIAEIIEETREPYDKIDLSLEMVDIDALDTGQYHAMVIVDPNNKRNIKGFFHIAVAYSTCIPQGDWRSGSYFPDILALPHLVEKMNDWTDIKTDITGSFPLDSKEIFNTPFVFISVHNPFKVSDSEAVNFGKYLCSRGFALVEDCWANIKGDADRALRQMLKDALLTQGLKYGKDWNFDMLPNDHPVFHVYFDLDGPPVGWGGICYHRDPNNNPIHEYLEGIHVNERLVAIYSNRDYGDSWDFCEAQGINSTREFQFGINMIIFALTQEGSITHRVMNAIQ